MIDDYLYVLRYLGINHIVEYNCLEFTAIKVNNICYSLWPKYITQDFNCYELIHYMVT